MCRCISHQVYSRDFLPTQVASREGSAPTGYGWHNDVDAHEWFGISPLDLCSECHQISEVSYCVLRFIVVDCHVSYSFHTFLLLLDDSCLQLSSLLYVSPSHCAVDVLFISLPICFPLIHPRPWPLPPPSP